MKTDTTTTAAATLVYAPRAVVYGPQHAHEGGGGLEIPVAEAIALGATNIRQGEHGFVADWPQSYWPEPGASCPCAACQHA